MPNEASFAGQTVIGIGNQGLFSALSNPITMVANYSIPSQFAAYPELVNMFQIGAINFDTFKHTSRLHGYSQSEELRNREKLTRWRDNIEKADEAPDTDVAMYPHSRYVQLAKNWPSVYELNQMFNRSLITPSLYGLLMNINTQGELGLSEAYKSLRFEIPGPSDLIRFAVREAYTPELLVKFGYNKELPVHVLEWMNKQGLGGNIGLPMPPGSTTTIGPETRTQAQWFDLYWWSHWDLPSNTQGMDMLHRLYPKSRYGASPEWSHDVQFTADDMELLQKANDIPDYWRQRLQAISYSPLTRVDVRRMHKQGVIKDDEVYHSYRAIGYNDRNANMLTEWTKAETAKVTVKDVSKGLFAKIEKYYKSGAIPDATLRSMLEQLQYKPQQIDFLFSIWDNDLILSETDIVKKQIQRGFLDGIFNIDQAKSGLANVGINQRIIDRHVRIWQRELFVTRKYISAEKAVSFYVQGIIHQNELQSRLHTLHYPDSEISVILRSANIQIVNNGIKANEKIQTKIVAEQKRIEKANEQILQQQKLKAAKEEAAIIKERDKAIKVLISLYSDKNIIAFYKAKQITESMIREVLSYRGWNETQIDKWINTYIDPIDLEEGEDDEEETSSEISE